MFLSHEPVNDPYYGMVLDTTCQVSFAIDSFSRWTLVSAEFIASGGEKYFCLGNFTQDYLNNGIRIYPIKSLRRSFAYYYLDDISIIDITTNGSLSITPGQKLIYNNILFDVGKSTITKSSYAQLDQIVAAMKKQSTLKVQISGHTDSDGDPSANQTLSEQRAISVKNYFISKGIDSTRITTKGFGSSQPLGSDKFKNRRVEFVFTQ